MKLLTPKQMREIDKKAITKYHIPGVLLMEHAAYQIFSYIKKQYDKKNVVICCGPGNNGGDGLALARQLVTWSDCKVKVILLAKSEQLTEEGRCYYDSCSALAVEMIDVDETDKQLVLEVIDSAHVVVDALFGTGLTRDIDGVYKEVIEHINQSKAYVVSVDIPSGVDGLTGKIRGASVDAQVTITFMTPKIGMTLYPGVLQVGELKIVDIGIPKVLIEEVEAAAYSIEKDEMKQLLPARPVRSNKGTFGKVLTIGGQLGMAGAICLASRAAYQVGCGTVTTLVPRSILEIVQQKLTEVMAIGASDTQGHFNVAAVRQLAEVLPHYDVVAIGPGMGRNKDNLLLLVEVLKSNLPCVIDADALFFIPEVLELLKVRKAPTILTPHPGEMARLTGLAIEAILENPLEVAMDFSKKFNVITLLKLEKTVIADTSGIIYINRYGNSGLAKGGSGDALTGILAGFLGEQMKPLEAARLGVYLQTRAADFAKDALSEYSFLASDTIHFLSKVFLELT